MRSSWGWALLWVARAWENDIAVALVNTETNGSANADVFLPSAVQQRSAFLLAMSHVHEAGLLTNYTLVPILVDAGQDTTSMFRKVLNLSSLPSLVGIVGPDLSSMVDIISPIAIYRKVVLVSPSATSPVLSHRDKYPYFFRVAPPDTRQALAYIELCQHFKWRSFATYSSNDIYGEYLMEALTREAKARGIAVLRSFSHVSHLDDEALIESHLSYLAESDAKIFIFIGQGPTAKVVDRVGRRLGIIGAGYAWIGSDGADPTTVGPGWLCVSPSGFGVRAEHVKNMVLSLPHSPAENRSACWFLNDCAESSFSVVQENNVPLLNSGTNFLNPYVTYYYQAVFAIAHALQQLLEVGGDIRDGQSLRDQLYNTSFESYTSNGNFTFDNNGDPIDAGYAVYNGRSKGDPLLVATIDAIVGKLTLTENKIFWMGGQSKPPTSGELESLTPLLWQLAIVFGVFILAELFLTVKHRERNVNAQVSVMFMNSLNLYDIVTDVVLIIAINKTILIVTDNELFSSIIFVALPWSANFLVFSMVLCYEFWFNPQFSAWFLRNLEGALPLLLSSSTHVGNLRALDSGLFSKPRFKAPVSIPLRVALPPLSYWSLATCLLKIITKVVYFLALDARASLMFWVAVLTSSVTLLAFGIYCRSRNWSNSGEVEKNWERKSRLAKSRRSPSQSTARSVFVPWTPHLRSQILAALKSKDVGLVATLLENVVRVDLTYSRLHSEDVGILAQAVPVCRCLEELDLEFNDIGEEGAEFLARGLKEQGIARSGVLDAAATCWQTPVLTSVNVDRTLRLSIKKASLGFTSSEELAAVISEVAVWAPRLVLRLSVSLEANLWLSWNGRRSLIAELAGSPPLKDLILRLEQAHPKIVFRNDDKGFSAYKSACPLVKQALDDLYQFCGRYDLNQTPEHRSATCVVYRALDLESDQSVVLKFMKNADQFQREIQERQSLSSDFVVPILRDSSSFGERWAVGACEIGLADHPLGVVMPAAERNLMVVLLQERVDWNQVKNLIFVVVQCLQHLHSNGRIHGDLKPLNIVRMFETVPEGGEEKKGLHEPRRKSRTVKRAWRLIDFDAAVKIGSHVGLKTSTAYCPPELTMGDGKMVQFREPNQGAPYSLLEAHPSFDMWSLGVILYRALAHQPLLEADDRDNLRGLQEFNKLRTWGPRLLDIALTHADSILRADKVSVRKRLAACDLMGWLLQVDPRNRPLSCDKMLPHAFFLQGDEWFMSALHVAAGLEDGETAQTLIKAKPELLCSQLHPTGKSPLHLAAECGSITMVALLLEKGAPVDAKDAVGNTALHSVLHFLGQYEWLTEELLPTCSLLAKHSDLSLKDASAVWSSLDRGISSPNPAVRSLFELEFGRQWPVESAIPVISWSQIECGKSLGLGDCSTVQACIWNGGDYALKIPLPNAQEPDLTHEISVNRHLSYHPHSSVVRMIGSTASKPFGLLMELYPLRSVYDHVIEGNNFRSSANLLTLLVNASAGVLHLHSLGIIHRDIAARNFLIKHDLSTAICDFGLARRLSDGQHRAYTSLQERRTEKVPINISAPETVLTGEYSRSTDVFMFGMFIHEVLSRQSPHSRCPELTSRPSNIMGFIKKLVEGLRPEIPLTWPLPIRDVLQACWSPSALRPDMCHVNQALRAMRDSSIPSPLPAIRSECAESIEPEVDHYVIVADNPSSLDDGRSYISGYVIAPADPGCEQDSPG